MIWEIVVMAARSLRAHPMRSALTLSGIVIGITAVVGMSALIRGVDRSISSGIRAMNPRVVYLAKFGGRIVTSYEQWRDLERRPAITPEDARGIRESCPSVGILDAYADRGGWAQLQHRDQKSRELRVLGVGEHYLEVTNEVLAAGRYFTPGEVTMGARVIVLGAGPAESLFPGVDPVGKSVRMEGQEYAVVGTLVSQADVGGMNLGQDNVALVPYPAHVRDVSGRRGSMTLTILPKEGVPLETMLDEVEEYMRIRHGLRADQDDDFDLVTQESILELWRNVSRAIFLALLGISSVALLVGGIGVMAVMLVSVTERTREIGVRRAVGAKRRHILAQFLGEAAMLTGVGGAAGSLLGALAAWGVSALTKIPAAAPWDTFAMAVAMSTLIGIVFGLYPAHRASRVPPADVLRYE